MTVITGAAFRRCSTKNVSLKIQQYRQESTVLESLFNKVAGLKVCKLIKKRLQHGRFSLNISIFLEQLFLQNTSVGCFCNQNKNFITQNSLWRFFFSTQHNRHKAALSTCVHTIYLLFQFLYHRLVNQNSFSLHYSKLHFIIQD